jgi:hypothetical protein
VITNKEYNEYKAHVRSCWHCKGLLNDKQYSQILHAINGRPYSISFCVDCFKYIAGDKYAIEPAPIVDALFSYDQSLSQPVTIQWSYGPGQIFQVHHSKQQLKDIEDELERVEEIKDEIRKKHLK